MLESLANVTDPFKVEVFRAGGGPGVNNDNRGGWLDTLTSNIYKLCRSRSTLTGFVESDLGRNQERFFFGRNEAAQFPKKSGKGRNQRTPKQGTVSFASTPRRQLAVDVDAAVLWLVADIERVASLFAREASVLSAAAVSSSGDAALDAVGAAGRGDVTVKLELLNKGKCPRFHLDKVVPPENGSCVCMLPLSL